MRADQPQHFADRAADEMTRLVAGHQQRLVFDTAALCMCKESSVHSTKRLLKAL